VKGLKVKMCGLGDCVAMAHWSVTGTYKQEVLGLIPGRTHLLSHIFTWAFSDSFTG